MDAADAEKRLEIGRLLVEEGELVTAFRALRPITSHPNCGVLACELLLDTLESGGMWSERADLVREMASIAEGATQTTLLLEQLRCLELAEQWDELQSLAAELASSRPQETRWLAAAQAMLKEPKMKRVRAAIIFSSAIRRQSHALTTSDRGMELSSRWAPTVRSLMLFSTLCSRPDARVLGSTDICE